VIPNGIDTERFVPRKKERGTINVVFMSRLDADCSRAASALCRVAKTLDARYGDIRITICGGGSEYQKILALADSANQREGKVLVEAIGHVERTEEILGGADVFVGVSRAALEAMSCAVPVVLAGDEGFFGALDTDMLERARSTNFCCRGERTLCDEALLEALQRLLDMPMSARKRLGSELRSYVERMHSAENMADMTEKLYFGVCQNKTVRQGGVLICGYYGFGNMGDDILLTSALRRAKEKYHTNAVCVLTERGARDERCFPARCVQRKNVLAVVSEIKRSRAVVFGGGTLLQNDTSKRSLWYYLFVLLTAQKYGKRAELWGNGIGEIRGAMSRRLCAKALAWCGYVGVRDKASLIRAHNLMREHGYALPHVELERDLAFGELVENDEMTEALLRQLGVADKPRIAVVILRGADRGSHINAFEKWIAQMLSDGIVPVFAVMYPKQDLDISRSVCDRLGGSLAYPITPSDLSGLIKRSAIVCSMRYHGLVLAANAGVPFIGFGTEEKVRNFCIESGGIYYSDILQKINKIAQKES
jgi:polysaccharide pyruvyl transferase CsaB